VYFQNFKAQNDTVIAVHHTPELSLQNLSHHSAVHM